MDPLTIAWLEAVLAAPLWLLAAPFATLLVLILILRSHWRWPLALALLTLFIAAGLQLRSLPPILGTAALENNAVEMRMAGWRAQVAAQPVLACLDAKLDEIVDAACERALFSRPEHLAAATAHLRQGMNLLKDAQQSSGARSFALQRELDRVRTFLERDRFGLVANLLDKEEGCATANCEALLLLSDRTEVQDNIAERTFEKRVAQHFDGGVANSAAVESRPGSAAFIVATPVPPKYVLPSSDSIPPVSIMNDEPRTNGDVPMPRRPAAPASKPPKQNLGGPKTSGNAAELKPLVLSQ